MYNSLSFREIDRLTTRVTELEDQLSTTRISPRGSSQTPSWLENLDPVREHKGSRRPWENIYTTAPNSHQIPDHWRHKSPNTGGLLPGYGDASTDGIFSVIPDLDPSDISTSTDIEMANNDLMGLELLPPPRNLSGNMGSSYTDSNQFSDIWTFHQDLDTVPLLFLLAEDPQTRV